MRGIALSSRKIRAYRKSGCKSPGDTLSCLPFFAGQRNGVVPALDGPVRRALFIAVGISAVTLGFESLAVDEIEWRGSEKRGEAASYVQAGSQVGAARTVPVGMHAEWNRRPALLDAKALTQGSRPAAPIRESAKAATSASLWLLFSLITASGSAALGKLTGVSRQFCPDFPRLLLGVLQRQTGNSTKAASTAGSFPIPMTGPESGDATVGGF